MLGKRPLTRYRAPASGLISSKRVSLKRVKRRVQFGFDTVEWRQARAVHAATFAFAEDVELTSIHPLSPPLSGVEFLDFLDGPRCQSRRGRSRRSTARLMPPTSSTSAWSWAVFGVADRDVEFRINVVRPKDRVPATAV